MDVYLLIDEIAPRQVDGFRAYVAAREERRMREVLRQCEPKDVLKFGTIPEFVGCSCPVIATLENLEVYALVKDGVDEVIIDKDVVEGRKEPVRVYAKKKESGAA